MTEITIEISSADDPEIFVVGSSPLASPAETSTTTMAPAAKLMSDTDQPDPSKDSEEDIKLDPDELSDSESQHGTTSCSLIASKIAREIKDFKDDKQARLINAANQWKLLTYKELPDWLRDNDFLHRYHRPQLNSFCLCIKSVFRIHTETGNIWTHLIGALIFMALAVELYAIRDVKLNAIDKIIFAVFFSATLMCLLFSSIYHIFSCHSLSVSKTCQAFDYVGIAIMITGSMISYLYYVFFCDFTSMVVYLAFFPIAGTAVAIVTLWPKMGQPEFRAIRATVFVAFGLSAVVPYIHFLISGEIPINHYKLIGMASVYIIGAAIYANRVPERIKPGFCDIWCQSHQLFHICVVVAALIHYWNIHEIAALREYGHFSCPIAVEEVTKIIKEELI